MLSRTPHGVSSAAKSLSRRKKRQRAGGGATRRGSRMYQQPVMERITNLLAKQRRRQRRRPQRAPPEAPRRGCRAASGGAAPDAGRVPEGVDGEGGGGVSWLIVRKAEMSSAVEISTSAPLTVGGAEATVLVGTNDSLLARTTEPSRAERKPAAAPKPVRAAKKQRELVGQTVRFEDDEESSNLWLAGSLPPHHQR
jgi:hypothetical protein